MKNNVMVVLTMLGFLAAAASAGLSYGDPPGGWTYVFTGEGNDGTWNHDNGSDQYDDSNLTSGKPGGAGPLTEAGVAFFRIQDPGDPTDFSISDPSNRKIMFGHSITGDGATNEATILDSGITLTFRARLATTPPLDQIHPDGGGTKTDVPATGDGYYIHDGGKGNFVVSQSSGEKTIGFALAVASDHTALGGKSGLIMNNLNGTSVTGTVDTGEAGTLQILEVANLTDWHEFWITIQADSTGGGTHLVKVYVDGGDVPTQFSVTAGNGRDYSDTFMSVGCGATGQSGAFDIDFLAYAPGIWPAIMDPTFNPAPVVDAKPDSLAVTYMENAVQLNGTVSDLDPIEGEPGVLSWQWAKASGPGTATFSDPAILNPTVTFDLKGTYRLVLEATDGTKDANDIVSVLVLDHADDKMIAHWNFDVEDGARDVLDSANHNDGDFSAGDANGLPSYVPGWIGTGALSFPGDGYVAVAIDSNSVPSFKNEPRYGASVSAWIKVNKFDQTWQTVVARGDDSWRLARNGDSNGMALHFNGLTTNPAYGPSGSISVNDGLWHHVAGTYNGATLSLYIDGVLDVTQAGTGFVPMSTYPVWIGANSQTNPPREWNGLLDDVRVYNYGLTEAEVLALTAMGKVPPSVNAGPDQSAQYRPGQKLALNGSVVDKGLPGPLSITWATVSGPADAAFDDPGSAVTQISFTEFGVYVLSLTGENSYTAVTDTIQIEVLSPTCADVIAEGKVLVGDISGPELKGTPDCRVDMYDLAYMAEGWMICNDPANTDCAIDPYAN